MYNSFSNKDVHFNLVSFLCSRENSLVRIRPSSGLSSVGVNALICCDGLVGSPYVCPVAYEGGLGGGSTPTPPPKFLSFDKAEPNFLL
jgi:hypothetical protein